MMTKQEITAWLNTLPEDAEIGIDDGGMCLQVLGSEEYLEVGALREDRCEQCQSTKVTTQNNGTVVCDTCGHEQPEAQGKT
jgi:hypothetical protein